MAVPMSMLEFISASVERRTGHSAHRGYFIQQTPSCLALVTFHTLFENVHATALTFVVFHSSLYSLFPVSCSCRPSFLHFVCCTAHTYTHTCVEAPETLLLSIHSSLALSRSSSLACVRPRGRSQAEAQCRRCTFRSYLGASLRLPFSQAAPLR